MNLSTLKDPNIHENQNFVTSYWGLVPDAWKQYFLNVWIITNKFKWTLDDIRIEKIISTQISATNFFCSFFRHCPKLQSCTISKKYTILRKNPNFGHSLGPPKIFPWVLPLLVVRQCPKLSSYAIFWKTNEPKKKSKKTNFGPNFGLFGRPTIQCNLKEN